MTESQGTPPEEDQDQGPASTPPVTQGNGYPLALRASIIAAFAATLIVHIFVDVFVDSYEGAATSLMLGGIVGTALGINEFVKGRSG